MVKLIGIGPGSKDYILPAAINEIRSSYIIIGAARNIEAIKEHHSNFIDLSVGFDVVADYLKGNYKKKDIGVVVSGDAGFYSLLAFVKRKIPLESIKVIPGISSLQYFYSKLNLGYEDSKWISLHGRHCDIDSFIHKKENLGILTDKYNGCNYIATRFKANNIENVKLYIGERLSYPEEKITSLTLEEALEYRAEVLSVVVVIYE